MATSSGLQAMLTWVERWIHFAGDSEAEGAIIRLIECYSFEASICSHLLIPSQLDSSASQVIVYLLLL